MVFIAIFGNMMARACLFRSKNLASNGCFGRFSQKLFRIARKKIIIVLDLELEVEKVLCS